jgi:hypothetical protein
MYEPKKFLVAKRNDLHVIIDNLSHSIRDKNHIFSDVINPNQR